MATFARLFALYFLILSCLPCSDGEHGHSQAATVPAVPVSILMSADAQGCLQHRYCVDLCSPFCTCNCCCITISLPQKTAEAPFLKVNREVIRRAFPENSFILQDMAFAIDHPPRLS